jgi:hypothetical protein
MCDNHEDKILADKMREILEVVDKFFDSNDIDEKVNYIKELVEFEAETMFKHQASGLCDGCCGGCCSEDDVDEPCGCH